MTDIKDRIAARARAAELKSKPLTTLKSVAELIVAKAKEKKDSTEKEMLNMVARGIRLNEVEEYAKAEQDLVAYKKKLHGGSRKGAGRPADPSVQLKYRIKKEMAMEVDAAIRELLSRKYGIVPKKIATKNSSD